MSDYDVGIVGAGIVGVSTALWSQWRGHKTVVVDPNPPGSGASFGNACTLATYACMPVNDPSVFKNLPALLFSPNSPLSISYAHALKNPKWMLSFLANCTEKRSSEIAQHLANLLAHADAGLNPLIAEAGAEDLVVNSGQLSIWSTNKAADDASASLTKRQALGVTLEDLSEAEARTLEPNLALPIKRAVFYPTARHIHDPQELIRRMHARFTSLGGHTVTEKLISSNAGPKSVALDLENGKVEVGRLVVAAGALSNEIEGTDTQHLPLGTERGYHVIYGTEGDRVSRPVGWAEGGFYASPMAQGLRIAGTVEITGKHKTASTNRTAYLRRRVGKMFTDLPAPNSEWMGLRPTMPDALPVIGQSAASERIIHAFGHQHLGLTLGGITGRIVADLIEGRQPNIDISPLRPNRSFISNSPT